MNIPDIITSIIFTFIVCIAPPLTFSLIYHHRHKLDGKKITRRTAIIILVVTGVVTAFLAAVFNNGKYTLAPILIWSSINYGIMNKLNILMPPKNRSNDESETNIPEPNDSEVSVEAADEIIDSSIETENDIKKKSKSNNRLLPAVIALSALLVVCVVAFCVIAAKQSNQICTLNSQISDLKLSESKSDEKISSLVSQLDESKSENDFFESNIVFVCDNDEYYYHDYNSVTFHNCNEYWAYNIEAAKAKGYHKCSYDKSYGTFKEYLENKQR